MVRNRTDNYIGAIIHARVAEQDLPRYLQATIIDSAGKVAGRQMLYFQTMSPRSDRFSRQRRVTAPALAQLLRAYLSGEIHSILLGDGSLSAYSDEPIALVDLSVTSGNTHSLSIHGPSEVLDYEKVVSYLRRIVSGIRSDYGQVVAGERNYVLSLLRYMPIGDVADLYASWETSGVDSATSRFESEMHFYYSRQGDLRKCVPRAAWGNILSPEHTAALGGEECIRKDSGCFLLERWGENLYLQLTESLWDVSNEQLLALNRYFERIRFPGAPEPVFF